MMCPRCFHTIGEHYLCLSHGGELCWSAGAYKHEPKPRDLPPVPENIFDPWWDFLDEMSTEVKGKKMRHVMEEAIP
jgi:hypothetical protein